MNDNNKPHQQKKKYSSKLYEYLSDTSVNTRNKAFMLFSITVLIALFVAVPCGLIMQEPLSATIATILGAVFFSVLVIFSTRTHRIKQAKIVISLILIFIFLPGMFFTNGGAEGGTPVWLLLGTVYISMILEGRFKIVMLILNAVVTIIIWTVGYLHPELVTTYSKGGNYFDTIAALLIVSVIVYTLIGLNNTVERRQRRAVKKIQIEKDRLHRLFDQTARAFVSAVEKKDDFTKGNSIRIAEYARKVAELAGKDEAYAERVYYAALLHDVGMIGIPDKVIKNEKDPQKWDYEAMRQKPVIGEEILSSITEYPYLAQGAHYSHERYDGSGYPEGLKGEEIPEIARIIAVADAYVTMTTKKRYRDARPKFVARESFIKGGGETFDPVFAELMVKIMDTETKENPAENEQEIEKTISCNEYREEVSCGIPVETIMKRISFNYEDTSANEGEFSAPSIVLFDSYDRRVHLDEKSIEAYHYLEYGEIWFDKYSVSTAAIKMKEEETENTDPLSSSYEIIAGRFEDHVKLIMKGKGYAKEVIIALPSISYASYIGITGEHCLLTDITVETLGDTVGLGDIPRIADRLTYIDHLESDIPNIQIDRTRSDSTEGIEIEGKVKISFRTTSLPGANLVWHCPYILLFSSDDGRVGGENYVEYQMLKLNGEDDGDDRPCKNRFVMKRGPEFPGWTRWEELNKEGFESEIFAERKGGRIIVRSENFGIAIENTCTFTGETPKVYLALTGDQVALTDIRVEK
ncbi:MAG: HD domain-containing protein [Lachnospiraceae bacterium]|nr:HD domain-containing protein [Lachnospiraceae bacterium]